ncbi:MAG TPA: rRNA maturation RNase YbeY [Rhizomicrobium sp.]|nr:rRNA maturation RNase YbeY [Rhizomicrobium sp.]
MSRIAIRVEDPSWGKISRTLLPKLKRAVPLALEHGASPKASLTILLTDDAQLRELNSRFRSKNKPTNVLSFPSQTNGEHYLGDVAIAYGVACAEARAGRKTLTDHATHLAVHGILHLLGYDHETNRQAKIMEPLETKILAALGIADPYAQAA